jgi:ribokinase
VPLKECVAKCFYLTSLAGNLELAERIASQAVKCQALMAWNPGRGELAKGLTKVKSVLSAVNILIVNREEAGLVTKEKDLSGMFARLASPGLVVIITDGENGAHAHHDGTTWFANTTGIKSVSRTGAGDSFGSGFVAGWFKTKDMTASLALAMLNAESVIQHVGAKTGILRKWPSKKELARIPIKESSS